MPEQYVNKLKLEPRKPLAAVICIRELVSQPGRKSALPDLTRKYKDQVARLHTFPAGSGGGQAFLVVVGLDACSKAIDIAQSIVWDTDRRNIQSSATPVQLSLGLAAGIDMETDLGADPVAGLATVLAHISDNEVWIEEDVRTYSQTPGYLFDPAPMSIPGWPNKAYKLRVRRLLRSAPTDFVRNGLRAVYTSREELRRDLTPLRLLHLAAKGTQVLVAGRTLIQWTPLVDELIFKAREKQLTYQFLMSTRESCSELAPAEQEQIECDYEPAKRAFERALSTAQGTLEVRQTDQAVIDGVTCLYVLMPAHVDEVPQDTGAVPGEVNGLRKTLLVIQDVNAVTHKASLVFACPNKVGEQLTDDERLPDEQKCSCMAHGLYRRTRYRFDHAPHRLLPAATTYVEQLKEQPSREGLLSRNNQPEKYAGRMLKYFEAMQRGSLRNVPAPLCVQVQISGKCSTHCVMCEHYRDDPQNSLSPTDWSKVFQHLGEFGVKSCLFSGGEPLMLDRIDELIKDARNAKLAIGMLTNGTMRKEWDPDHRGLVLRTIADGVSWVAISVDGLPFDDEVIRRPSLAESERITRLKEFANQFKQGRGYRAGSLSATVTLQKQNINSDLRNLCEFIQNEIGIPQVNFKLATGAQEALGSHAPYLLDSREIDQFRRFLWESRLPDEEGNNLAYLRRCFAQEIFRDADVVAGAPLRGYYMDQDHPMRCFTPFLFAVIDLDGSIYPCCHLFRDNHGANGMTKSFRDRHRLGNVRSQAFGKIWNAGAFERIRNSLTQIDPSGDFAPCGECTRHCQHNIALNKLYKEYCTNPSVLGGFPNVDDPVWF